MRILLSTIGSRGDAQPLVALAWQIRALGHHAHFCVPPDSCDWIEALGFPVMPVGPDVAAIATTITGRRVEELGIGTARPSTRAATPQRPPPPLNGIVNWTSLLTAGRRE